jgi:predicted esterase
VVAPEALSRFYAGSERGRHGPGSAVGATWMTREDREHEIRDYVAYLDALDRAQRAVLPAPPPDVTVLGFSQGVATAARWTVLGAMRPRRLVLWGDFIPPDLDLARAREAWAATEVVLVRGKEDPVLRDARLAEAEAGRLEGAGLAPRVVSYERGHEIHEPTLLALAGAVGPR